MWCVYSFGYFGGFGGTSCGFGLFGFGFWVAGVVFSQIWVDRLVFGCLLRRYVVCGLRCRLDGFRRYEGWVLDKIGLCLIGRLRGGVIS